ncbi:MAG: response regulator [Anaerolineae bacterium]|nr:response regulator [Anaerolineae bacterium]
MNATHLSDLWEKLTRPRSTDVESVRREYMTKAVFLLLCSVTVPLTLIFGIGGLFQVFPLDSALFTLAMTLFFGGGWWLSHRGHWQIAGYIPPLIIFVTAVYGNVVGGAGAPAMVLYALSIALSAVLQGKWTQWVTLFLSVAVYTGISRAQLAGYMSVQRSAEAVFGNRVTIIGGTYASIAVLLWLLIGQFQRALIRQREAQDAEREQRVLAEALRDTAAALNSTLDFDEILGAILTNVGRVVPHDAVNIMLVDPSSGLAYVTRCRGYDRGEPGLEALVLGLRFSTTEVITLRHMLQTGEPFAIANTRDYPGWIDGPATHWVGSYAGAPIRIGGETVGFINLDNVMPGFFTPLHAERLRAFADQAAIAIQNAHLYEQAQREIAERRLAEQSLKSEQELFVQGPVVVFKWGVGEGWPVEYVSPNVDQFGYQVQDLLQGRVQYHDLIHPKDRDRVIPRDTLRATQEHKDTGLISSTLEYRIVCADGRVRWVYDYTRLVRDGQENLLYYHGYILDVTERKLAEEAGERLQAQLFQAQKMEAVGKLAGGIAHDFNNNLTAILGYTELLLEEFQDDPHVQDLKEIAQAASRSAALTRQLLAFSRKQIIQPITLNLNDVVSNMENMLHRLIGEDIRLITFLRRPLGLVEADPGQIEQSIVNLALNARDAIVQKMTQMAGPFEGKLTIETDNVIVDQAQADRHLEAEPGEYILLSVSDNGTGMDQETRQHLFEPFFTTKERGKGTGLGLASVYGAVHQNGGVIWVYSEPGLGTTFKIYLPRISHGDSQSHSPVQPNEYKRGTETILLVEDESMVRAFARRVLEEQGYLVLEAKNAAEAIALSESYAERIDLLLTDVILPGAMSGHGLVERLAPLRPAMRVVYMSGYTDNAIVHHGVLAPGVHFVQKPFRPEDLVQMIRESLDAQV